MEIVEKRATTKWRREQWLWLAVAAVVVVVVDQKISSKRDPRNAVAKNGLRGRTLSAAGLLFAGNMCSFLWPLPPASIFLPAKTMSAYRIRRAPGTGHLGGQQGVKRGQPARA